MLKNHQRETLRTVKTMQDLGIVRGFLEIMGHIRDILRGSF